MKSLLAIFAIVFASQSAQGATIATRLFSFEVPDQWRVENNETSIVLAFAGEMRNGAPSQFLSVQYCEADSASKNTTERRCPRTCEKESSSLSNNLPVRNAALSKATREDGTAEFTAEFAQPELAATGFVALLCGSRGQAHIELMSDAPAGLAKTEFLKVLDSFKWK